MRYTLRLIYTLGLVPSLLFITAALSSCSVTGSGDSTEFSYNDGRNIKYKIVNREVSAGMSQEEILKLFGDPSTVSRDSGESETWVYENAARTASYSTVSQRGGEAAGEVSRKLILTGVTVVDPPGQTPDSSQNMLSVMISFDEDKKVAEFKYYPALH